jgi:hypothetical protein
LKNLGGVSVFFKLAVTLFQIFLFPFSLFSLFQVLWYGDSRFAGNRLIGGIMEKEAIFTELMIGIVALSFLELKAPRALDLER